MAGIARRVFGRKAVKKKPKLAGAAKASRRKKKVKKVTSAMKKAGKLGAAGAGAGAVSVGGIAYSDRKKLKGALRRGLYGPDVDENAIGGLDTPVVPTPDASFYDRMDVTPPRFKYPKKGAKKKAAKKKAPARKKKPSAMAKPKPAKKPARKSPYRPGSNADILWHKRKRLEEQNNKKIKLLLEKKRLQDELKRRGVKKKR